VLSQILIFECNSNSKFFKIFSFFGGKNWVSINRKQPKMGIEFGKTQAGKTSVDLSGVISRKLSMHAKGTSVVKLWTSQK